MSLKDELESFDSDEPVVRSSRAQLLAAVAAHLAGFSYDVIAERYTYKSAKTAQIAIENMLGSSYTSSDLTAARNKSLARKERLLQAVWWDAIHPWEMDANGQQTTHRNEAHIAAVDRAVRLLESIDRLLGTNAPTQVEVYRPGADEFLTIVTDLKKAVMAGQPEEADIFDADVIDDEVDNGS